MRALPRARLRVVLLPQEAAALPLALQVADEVLAELGVDLGVKLRPDGDSFVIEFFDPEMPPELVAELADALASTANGMPALDSERGRGLFLLTVYLEGLRAAPAARGGICLSGRVQLQ